MSIFNCHMKYDFMYFIRQPMQYVLYFCTLKEK